MYFYLCRDERGESQEWRKKHPTPESKDKKSMTTPGAPDRTGRLVKVHGGANALPQGKADEGVLKLLLSFNAYAW